MRQRHRRGMEIQVFFSCFVWGGARGIKEGEWKQEGLKSCQQSAEFWNKIVGWRLHGFTVAVVTCSGFIAAPPSGG